MSEKKRGVFRFEFTWWDVATFAMIVPTIFVINESFSPWVKFVTLVVWSLFLMFRTAYTVSEQSRELAIDTFLNYTKEVKKVLAAADAKIADFEKQLADERSKAAAE